jgi:hypothetical protein
MCKLALPLALLVLVGAVSMASADDRDNQVRAKLSGYNEVHFSGAPPTALRGAVSTGAQGSFKATINEANQQIHYELSYEGLEGAVTQAHIHFGQPSTVGGIVVWLCETTGTPAPSPTSMPISHPVDLGPLTPECPPEAPPDNPVTGTIGPDQVLAQTAQGIAVFEFAELVRAIRAGATYANVHSALHPPGEIRGQIHGGLVGKILNLRGSRIGD